MCLSPSKIITQKHHDKKKTAHTRPDTDSPKLSTLVAAKIAVRIKQLNKKLRELVVVLVHVAGLLLGNLGMAHLSDMLDHWAAQFLEKVCRLEQESNSVRLVQMSENLVQGLLAQIVDPISVGRQVQPFPG